MNAFITNWKTTLIGVIILVSLVLMGFRIITAEQFVMIFGALVSAGLTLAKDNDK